MCFFFFSSRRRHTRLTCDWSSDVCSSDLALISGQAPNADTQADCPTLSEFQLRQPRLDANGQARSEERRVGKECRSRWGPSDEKKKRHRTMMTEKTSSTTVLS